MEQYPPGGPGPDKGAGDQGKPAEKVVRDVLQSVLGMRTREATPKEDAGSLQIGRGKQIDAVGYMSGSEKPAIAFQVTTATDSVVLKKKKEELSDNPFTRIDLEMKPSDIPIPRVVIWVDAAEVKAFLDDHDLAQHPKLKAQVLQSLDASLRFVILKTQRQEEKKIAQDLLAFVSGKTTAK